MHQSTITIAVDLDNNRVPERINWKATDSSADSYRKAKAIMLSFWDGDDKAALRMDLWTKEMMVDEMADFYFQTLMTMADAFQRATQQDQLSNDMKKFAEDFYNRFKENQIKESKIS